MYTSYQPPEEIVQRLKNNFTHHPPKGDQAERYERLRADFRYLAEEVCRLAPPSREQSLALTHMEEACMWANAAIARNE